MNKHIKFFIIITILLIMVNSCDKLDQGADNSKRVVPDSTTGITATAETPLVEFTAEVMEANDALLVTPNSDSNEYKSSDKIAVNVRNAKIIDKAGEAISISDIMAGDRVKISYNGVIAESYPAQITATSLQVTGHNKLIDGYLALVDDIYQEDSGLNSDIEMIALDTTGWVELSAMEKEIILMKMKDIYKVEIVEGTFEELAKQGMIDKKNLYFPKGVLITISEMKYKKDKITCGIEKWRSGLGAIGSDKVTAKYKNGKWTISKDGMWIS